MGLKKNKCVDSHEMRKQEDIKEKEDSKKDNDCLIVSSGDKNQHVCEFMQEIVLDFTDEHTFCDFDADNDLDNDSDEFRRIKLPPEVLVENLDNQSLKDLDCISNIHGKCFCSLETQKKHDSFESCVVLHDDVNGFKKINYGTVYIFPRNTHNDLEVEEDLESIRKLENSLIFSECDECNF